MRPKKKFKKYKELWIKIRDLIRSITRNSDDYDDNLDEELPLKKMSFFS